MAPRQRSCRRTRSRQRRTRTGRRFLRYHGRCRVVWVSAGAVGVVVMVASRLSMESLGAVRTSASGTARLQAEANDVAILHATERDLFCRDPSDDRLQLIEVHDFVPLRRGARSGCRWRRSCGHAFRSRCAHQTRPHSRSCLSRRCARPLRSITSTEHGSPPITPSNNDKNRSIDGRQYVKRTPMNVR